MTEPTASPLPAQPFAAAPSSYVQAWVESLAQVLGQIAGSPLTCAALPEAPAELAPPGEGDLWIIGACSGGLRGEMSLRLPPASILRLAQIFMSEPATPDVEVSSDHREATVELLRQVGGVVATGFKAAWGEVQLRLDSSVGAPSWSASSTVWLRAADDGSAAALVEMQLSAALVAALRAEKTEAAKPADPPSSSPPLPPSPEQSKIKLDLLMDVELAVTLRFGSRRLLLREILDLVPGAVVDLDRQVDEPVDVLLDGRLVARGEVVVLDGNYGLRVTEVAPASP
jgi:flagellar motor switch protein FliN/FliY